MSDYIGRWEDVRLIADYPQTVLCNRHNSSSISFQIPLETAPEEGNNVTTKRRKNYEYNAAY